MKRNKWAFLLLMTGLLVGCTPQNNNVQKTSLYENGLKMVTLLDEMVGNDNYVDAFSVSPEIKTIIENIGQGDYSEPEAVYELVFSKEYIAELLAGAGLTDTADWSDALKENLKQKMISSLITQLNAHEGAVTLAASSICTVGESFVNDDLQEDTIYVYTYKNAQPIAIVFLAGEDGSVKATANFIINEKLKGADKETIENFFEDIDAEVKVVK